MLVRREKYCKYEGKSTIKVEYCLFGFIPIYINYKFM